MTRRQKNVDGPVPFGGTKKKEKVLFLFKFLEGGDESIRYNIITVLEGVLRK